MSGTDLVRRAGLEQDFVLASEVEGGVAAKVRAGPPQSAAYGPASEFQCSTSGPASESELQARLRARVTHASSLESGSRARLRATRRKDGGLWSRECSWSRACGQWWRSSCRSASIYARSAAIYEGNAAIYGASAAVEGENNTTIHAGKTALKASNAAISRGSPAIFRMDLPFSELICHFQN
eukprot:3339997-Rhodomonas_salina.3